MGNPGVLCYPHSLIALFSLSTYNFPTPTPSPALSSSKSLFEKMSEPAAKKAKVDLEAANKAAEDQKAPAPDQKAPAPTPAPAAANATAAPAEATAAPVKETGSKTCILHCLETGEKLVANLAQIMEMSGTIRAMVEDLGEDVADSAAAAEIPIAGVSGDVARGILQFIEAYYADKATKKKTATKKEKTATKVHPAASALSVAGTFEPSWQQQLQTRQKTKKHDQEAAAAPNATAVAAAAAAASAKETGSKACPDSMTGLYRLGNDVRGGNDHWLNHSGSAHYIHKLVEAVEFLDMPELMTIILTIVGKEISECAAERMKKLGCSPIGLVQAPNGKLSIEGAGSSEDSNVAALAEFVAKLRDIQPELVDKRLASVLYEAQPNAALRLNHLIEKEAWDCDDACSCVAAAETDRTGMNVFRDQNKVAYSAGVAAASWEGIEKHSTAVPNLFFGVPIPKVLKQVHPNNEISKSGQKVISDLIAWTVDAILAAVPATEDADRFATVYTNSFLADGSTKQVLASRLVPRDEVLVHHADEGLTRRKEREPARFWHGFQRGKDSSLADPYSWELRNEVVRVGLADALTSFDAKSTGEQEAIFKAHCDDNEGLEGFLDDNDVTSSRAIQTAVRRVFPGELAKHAVSEGVKAVTEFTSCDCGGVSFKDGKVGYSRKLTAASDVDDVNTAISGAAGLQASVLETAHAMHLRLSNPPSLAAAVYLTAVMEYLAAEILELSGSAARDNRSTWIQPRHLQHAVLSDEELNKMFQDVSILNGGVLPNIHTALLPRHVHSGNTPISTRVPRIEIPSADEAVATIAAFLKDDADEGSNVFVSGTRVGGFDRDEMVAKADEEGLGANDALSAGAAWVDTEGAPAYKFTTLSLDDQAALLEPAGVTPEGRKAAAEKAEAAKVPFRGCRRILRDSIQNITQPMILALAARAGCLMVSGLVFEETRGIIMGYLESLIPDAVALAEHKKRNVVFATDVLAAATSHSAFRIVCGTGRVASMYATSGGGGGGDGGTPPPFATLAAEYSAKLARGQHADGDRKWAYPAAYRADDDEGEYLDMCDEDGFNEAVTRAWTTDLDDKSHWTSTYEAVDEEYDEDEFRGRARHGSGMPYLTKEEMYADPKQVSGAALRYIRQMQQTSGPCLPFMPLTKLVCEIAQGYKTDLDFEPEAFRVIQSMLEDYLVGLFKDANLSCIHGGGSSHRTFPFVGFEAGDPEQQQGKRSFAIQPKDLQLARQIRNGRV